MLYIGVLYCIILKGTIQSDNTVQHFVLCFALILLSNNEHSKFSKATYVNDLCTTALLYISVID